MQERKRGCICELDTDGNPTIENYAECPVHRTEAPTPASVAETLVKKFHNVADNYDKGEGSFTSSMHLQNKKQGAIIVVDEILDVLSVFTKSGVAKVLVEFYKNVKEEIQKYE